MQKGFSFLISVSLEYKIDAFEMWLYRKMLKASYLDKIKDEEILGREITRQNCYQKLN